jgi:hypothetical protein
MLLPKLHSVEAEKTHVTDHRLSPSQRRQTEPSKLVEGKKAGEGNIVSVSNPTGPPSRPRCLLFPCGL